MAASLDIHFRAADMTGALTPAMAAFTAVGGSAKANVGTETALAGVCVR